MNPQIKQKWVDALRSGEYKQSKGALRNVNNEFCCLGVLCDLYNQEQEEDYWKVNENDLRDYCYLTEDKLPPYSVIDWAELKTRNPGIKVEIIGKTHDVTVASANDEGFSFDEIADLIEAQF